MNYKIIVSVSILFLFYIQQIHCLNKDQHNEILNKFFEKGFLNELGKYVEQKQLYNVSQCFYDIKLWREALFSKDNWARKMIDSDGKIPPGLLTLNLNSFGQYDQCISIVKNFQNSPTIHGKYCLAKIPLLPSPDESEEEIRFFTKISNAVKAYDKPSPRMTNFDAFDRLSLIFGICIPDSCKTDEIRLLIDGILAAMGITMDKPLITIPEKECSTSEPPEWTSNDWGALAFFIIFAVIMMISTAYDIFTRYKKKIDNDRCHNFFVSFSIWTNTSNLMRINKNSKDIKCLHGLRALSILWVIMGHRFTYFSLTPMINFIDLIPWLEVPGSAIILGGVFAVDTFFTLSGLLVAYISFKKLNRKKCFNIPLMYLHRYLRLTPALAAFIFFVVTLYRFLGNGPLWNKLMDDIAINCEKNWWTAILYVQNYVDPSIMCIPQTWYLCCDMQLFILSPIIIFPLLKWKRIGWANVIFWTLIAQITTFVIAYENEWSGATSALKGINNRETRFYYVTHTRATPWLLGFIGGYLLHLSTQTKLTINKIVVILGWLGCLAILAAVIFGLIPLQKLDHEINHLEDTTYNAFAKTGWAIAVIWVVITCAHGYGGPINWFLSLSVWEIISRLSYCMYLVHIHLQYIIYAMIRAPLYFSNFVAVMMFFGDVVLTLFIAYLLSISFEIPFAVLEKVIFYSKKPMERKNSIPNKESEECTEEKGSPNI